VLKLDKAKTGRLLVVGATLALAACGGSRSSTRTVGTPSRTVDIYSSLPLQGAATTQTDAIVNGIKLALLQAHGRAGRWVVDYRSLDDSTARTGNWDATQTATDARTAAADPNAVYYIGDFKGGTDVSLPILNQAGVPQLSPGSSYPGLTVRLPGTAAKEPGIYYPSGARTFLRLVPADTVQAAADLMAMHAARCRRVAIASDGETYGSGLAAMLELQKAWYRVTVVGNVAIDPTASSFTAYAAHVKAVGADCFFFAGVVSPAAVQVTEQVHAALPTAKIFGGDGVCTGSYTASRAGGVTPDIAPLIQCTSATGDLTASAPGRAFLAAYRARYGPGTPDPYAVYGYEAMSLGLSAITRLGPEGDSKSAVLRALFGTVARDSPIGSFRFLSTGDTTQRSFGLYRVGPNGTPVFARTLTPARVLS
jgi:branched-chain amino acid transport system substrate-binding protein